MRLQVDPELALTAALSLIATKRKYTDYADAFRTRYRMMDEDRRGKASKGRGYF